MSQWFPAENMPAMGLSDVANPALSSDKSACTPPDISCLFLGLWS